MLEANKSALFEKIFAVYNRNLLARRFHSLHISGLEYLRTYSINTPFIIYCNHSSWWDGLVAFQISHEANLNSFIMMEEKQLKNLFLFRKLGAFSVVREKPREAYQSLLYAAGLLTGKPDATLWIFPQGEILPNDVRPLMFYNGLGKLVRKVGECATTSLSIRYEFLGQFKPEIFVRITKPELFTKDNELKASELSRKFSLHLTENLDTLKHEILVAHLEKYQQLF